MQNCRIILFYSSVKLVLFQYSGIGMSASRLHVLLECRAAFVHLIIPELIFLFTGNFSPVGRQKFSLERYEASRKWEIYESLANGC